MEFAPTPNFLTTSFSQPYNLSSPDEFDQSQVASPDVDTYPASNWAISMFSKYTQLQPAYLAPLDFPAISAGKEGASVSTFHSTCWPRFRQADDSLIQLPYRPSTEPPDVVEMDQSHHFHPPSYHDLEPWKDEIKRLYLDEKRTLSDVMRYMRSKYGVKASVKQYKTKLRKWRFDKHHRIYETAAILHLQRQNHCSNRPLRYYLHGKPVDMALLDKSARRNKFNLTKVDLSSKQFREALEAVTVETLAPPLQSPKHPLEYKSNLFLCLKALVRGTLTEDHSLSGTLWAEISEGERDIHIYLASCIDAGNFYLRRSDERLAFTWWRKAFRLVDITLQNWSRETVLYLMGQMMELDRLSCHDICRSFRCYLAQKAPVVFGASDPRCEVFRILARMEALDCSVATYLLDLFEASDVAWSGYIFRERLHVIRHQVYHDRAASIDDLMPSIQDVDARFGESSRHSMETLRFRMTLVSVRSHRADLSDDLSESLSNELLQLANLCLSRVVQVNDRYAFSWYSIYAYYHLARAQFDLGMDEVVRGNVMKAMQMHKEHVACFGEPLLAMYDMATLMDILRDLCDDGEFEEEIEAWDSKIEELNNMAIIEDEMENPEIEDTVVALGF